MNRDDVYRLEMQKTKYRRQRDHAAAEAERIADETERLRRDNEALRSLAESNPLARRAAELESQIRQIEHRKVFDRLARERGVPDDAIDIVYRGSGYQADSPQPDEAAIGAMLDQAKGSPGLSRLFGSSANPDGSANPSATTTPMPPTWSPTPYRVPMSPDDPRHGDVRYIYENFDTISAEARARIERGEG